MSNLVNIWDNAEVESADWQSSDRTSSGSIHNESLVFKVNEKANTDHLSLSDHQKADSYVLSSIIANGRLGDLISGRLMIHYGSLAMVISASITELCRFGGLTKSQIITIKAVNTAALCLINTELNKNNIIFDDKSLINYLIGLYSRGKVECFRVLFLNSYNGLIADDLMASGTVNHVLPYPREIFRRAIELNATALILVHNHPSGDPTPSLDDIDSTIRICEIASTLQLKVHDHIIVAHGKMLSFRALGLLR